jgi:hypothetical protein
MGEAHAEQVVPESLETTTSQTRPTSRRPCTIAIPLISLPGDPPTANASA